MSDSIFLTGPQIYRFEFGCDGKIYSTQFTGELPPETDTRILMEVRRHLLEKSSGAICSFLEHNHIGYTHFTSTIKVLEYNKVMEEAGFLLHTHSSSALDSFLSEPAFYYRTMDCQKRFTNSCCKGCYYVIKKVSAVHSMMPHCRIIGQTFDDNMTTLQGYFAIRESRGSRISDIASSSGEPVLPSFGCVDVLNLLININHTDTIGQARKSAL